MEKTGIIRRVDELGRIVIPKEIRRTMGIREGDPFEILIDPENVTVGFCKYTKAQDDFIKVVTKPLQQAGVAFYIKNTHDEIVFLSKQFSDSHTAQTADIERRGSFHKFNVCIDHGYGEEKLLTIVVDPEFSPVYYDKIVKVAIEVAKAKK